MAIQRVTIEVSNIMQGGRTCENPSISVSLVNGLSMPCPIEDGFIELQLDGLEDGYCFDLVIDCEDCESCPPQVKRICLCDDIDDCEACESCTDGICVSNCETGELCDNGTCKECLVDANCLCNQECINGECACPPSLPIEVNGCCYECVEGTVVGCEICVGGELRAKDCGEDFLLDPEDCECKECLDSGDCDAPNTCCVDGECDCCPGYYYDPTAGGCIVIPDCSDTDDCPPCFNCVNGVCVEFVCPAGYLRTGIEGSCCVKECDCDAPSCPEGSVCTEYDESTCYCKPCTGACVDNTDCSEGCGCYNGNCEPKPRGCEGPCYTGYDCGFGCGCLDGECVDCKTLGCNNNEDCLLASGCTCDDGDCIGSECDNPCSDGADCDTGCGCEDGMCKDCTDVPCETTADCPDGCLCSGGICTSNPCDTEYCVRPEDCGEGCGCKDGECAPCATLDCVTTECDDTPGCACSSGTCGDDPDDDCQDNLTVTKIDDECKLRATLDTEDCCECPDIVLHVTAAFVTTTLTVTGSLRKGTTAADPLLSATGVDNELPLTGSVKFIVRQDEIEVDSEGAPTGLTRSTEQSVVKNYAGSDVKTQNFTITEIGDIYTDAGKDWKVLHICVSIEHVAVFTFENECQYKAYDRELVCDANGSGLLQLTKLVRCKTPIFTWYESTDDVTYAEIRKVYGERVDANTYRDDASAADGLEVCKYYKVEVDCGCDPDEYYSCNGDETAATKLTFCQPEDLDITPANDCLTEIDIAEVEVCDVMIGAEYNLYINGVLEGTYTVNGSGILFAGGENIVKSEPITEVRLVFVCDECDECTITKTFSISGDPCDCSGTGMTISVDTTNACSSGIAYTINDGTGPYEVIIKRGVTTIYTTTQVAAGTFNYNNILPNGTYILQVTDAFGCVKTSGFIINACCQIVGSLLTFDCGSREITGTVTASNASGTYIVEIGSPAIHSFNVAAGAFTEAYDLVDGIYVVKITDSLNGDCYWLGSLYVGCGDLDLTITPGCDFTNPVYSRVALTSPTNGTAPYLAQIYAGDTVTVDGSGCPTDAGQLVTSTTTFPYSLTVTDWDETTEVVVVLSDATGRSRCFPAVDMLNCADNNFDFTVRFSCSGVQKRVCITANTTDTYDVTIGTDPLVSSTLTAASETCFNTSLANGAYSVILTNSSGVTVTKNVVVTTCDSFTASYDCTTGLSLFQNGTPWTGKIRVDGTPVSFWDYTGPSTVWLADTTPNHTVVLYNASLTIIATLSVTGIDCCSVTIRNLSGVCDPITNLGRLEFTINNTINVGSTHTVVIKDSSNGIVESNPNWSGTNYVSGDLPNDTYTVFVTDDTYITPNVGYGTGYECQAVATTTLNCLSCTILSGLNATLITLPGTLRLTINNANGYAVNYEVWRNDVPAAGDCLAATDPPPGSEEDNGSLNAGASVTIDYPLNAPGTDPCFYVKFIKQSDPTCKGVKLATAAN